MDKVAESFRFDDIVVRPDVFSVEKSGRTVALEPKSIRVLIHLIENRPRAVSKEELLNKVWEDAAVSDNSLTRAIALLRKAIGDDAKVARYIETVPTLGYRFIADVVDEQAPTAPLRAPVESQAQWKIACAILALALIVTAVIAWQRAHPADAPVWSGNLLGGPIIASHPRISPDGQLLAFRAVVDGLTQVAVMKPDAASWTVLTNDRENGAVASVAWSRDASKIYFDREWGPGNIYSIGPLGGEPRLVLTNAWIPEPLADGSLIALRPTSEGHQQLVHFWPDSGRLESLPATIQSADSPHMRAFPDGKEVAVYGVYRNTGRPHLFALDIASGKARDLADPMDQFENIAVAADGRSVLGIQHRDDVAMLQSLPRSGSKEADPILSFPQGSSPLSVDAAPDGSLYMDQSHFETSILTLGADGRTQAEIPLPQRVNNIVPLPDGESIFDMWRGGRSQIFIGKPGAEPRLLLNTTDSASLPGASLGEGKIVFLIGRRDNTRLAIASIADGRVSTRFTADARSVGAVAASVDRQTIYYAADGVLWAQPVAGGDPKKIGDGYDIAADPSGKYLYTMRTDENAYGLWRIPTAGGAAEKMQMPAGYNLTPLLLSSAAINADGRILMPVNERGIFFYQAAVFDPVKGTMTHVPTPPQVVIQNPGWTPGGKIVFRLTRWSSSLWRYRTVPKKIPPM